MSSTRARRAGLAALASLLCLVVSSAAAIAGPYEPNVAGTPSSDCANSKGDLGKSGISPANARFNGASAQLRAALADDGTIVVADTHWIRTISGGQIRTIFGPEGSDGGPRYLALAVRGTRVYVVEAYWDTTPQTPVFVARILELDRNGPPTQEPQVRAFLAEAAPSYALALDANGGLWVADGRPPGGKIGRVTDGDGVEWKRSVPIESNDLAMSADASRAYVVGSGTRVLEVGIQSAQGSVTELGTEGPAPAGEPARLALDREGGRLYVSDGETITRVDLGEPTKAVDVGPVAPAQIYAGSLAYDRMNKKLLVADLITCTIGTVDPVVAQTPAPPSSPNTPGGPVGGNTGGNGSSGGGTPVLGSGGSGSGATGGDAPLLTAPGGEGSGTGAGSGATDGGGSSAGSSSGAPADGGAGGGQTATDPSQLTGTRAAGDFGQFNPFAGSGPASANSGFVPSPPAGGQGFSGFAPGPAATDPFSGGGALVGTGPGPGEVAAIGAGPPEVSVANPGPVGAVAPPPAASSPTPVQGWAGAPGPPAQGAARYAMVAEEQGLDPALYGLLGLGGCCLLLAIGAGTRRGGKATATAKAAAPARAWAVGR